MGGRGIVSFGSFFFFVLFFFLVEEGGGKKGIGEGGEYANVWFLAELRIHEYTERGDNDSIKRAGKGGATMGGCCGGAGAR